MISTPTLLNAAHCRPSPGAGAQQFGQTDIYATTTVGEVHAEVQRFASDPRDNETDVDVPMTAAEARDIRHALIEAADEIDPEGNQTTESPPYIVFGPVLTLQGG